MAGIFVLFAMLFLCDQLPLAVISENSAVSMLWHHVGTGCFKYDLFRMVLAKTKEDCLQQCFEEVRCALVAYRKKKYKCALCEEGYEHKTSCPYHVELIAKDVNECAIKADNCETNAVCVNTPGSFECRCKPGYYKGSGKHCTQVPVVEWIRYEDSCLEATSSFTVTESPNIEDCKLKCQINSRCTMVEYRYHSKKCRMAKHRKFKAIPSCQFRTDLFVKAIVECDHEEKRCPQHAYCHAKKGNRFCQCRFGYKGDGKICNDVNECTTYKNLCGQYAKCHNTIGSFKCGCLSGYHGDGQLCRKDKLKEKENSFYEENDKGTFHTIINLFNGSGSHRISSSSQVVTFLVLYLLVLL